MSAYVTALLAWEKSHDALSELYRLAARESEQGYDRESTRLAIDEAEKAEHAAWLAYRDLEAM